MSLNHAKLGVGAAIGATQTQTHNVFVYGSLLADEVVKVLLNRVPPTSYAVLDDFHRFSIKGRVYPSILPVKNNKVNGRVLLGISDEELNILDIFEDVEYQRTDVDVLLTDSSEWLRAYAYVWSNGDDPNLYGDWNFEAWKLAHMDDFINMTKGFMEELELPESKPRVETYESFFKSDERPNS